MTLFSGRSQANQSEINAYGRKISLWFSSFIITSFVAGGLVAAKLLGVELPPVLDELACYTPLVPGLIGLCYFPLKNGFSNLTDSHH